MHFLNTQIKINDTDIAHNVHDTNIEQKNNLTEYFAFWKYDKMYKFRYSI